MPAVARYPFKAAVDIKTATRSDIDATAAVRLPRLHQEFSEISWDASSSFRRRCILSCNIWRQIWKVWKRPSDLLAERVRVMQPQCDPWLELIQLKSIGGFANPVFEKGPLQNRIFALDPVSQQQLASRNHFAIGPGDHFGGDHLGCASKLIKGFWSSSAIDAFVSSLERPSYGFALWFILSVIIHFRFAFLVSDSRRRDHATNDAWQRGRSACLVRSESPALLHRVTSRKRKHAGALPICVYSIVVAAVAIDHSPSGSCSAERLTLFRPKCKTQVGNGKALAASTG
jgi:hypothetical protein